MNEYWIHFDVRFFHSFSGFLRFLLLLLPFGSCQLKCEYFWYFRTFYAVIMEMYILYCISFKLFGEFSYFPSVSLWYFYFFFLFYISSLATDNTYYIRYLFILIHAILLQIGVPMLFVNVHVFDFYVLERNGRKVKRDYAKVQIQLQFIFSENATTGN